MKKLILPIGFLFIFCSQFSYSWGPTAQISIVNNALYLIDKELNINLKKLETEVKLGASITDDLLLTLIPIAQSNPIQAIENEINLLTATKPKKIDPYYAYRLGVLGKLVAQATSPLQNADITIRTLYNADVEKAIEKTKLKTTPRQKVNPSTYFPQLIRQITSRDAIIEQEYKTNIGFSGTAQTTLSESVSISVNAIADVWFTILTPGQTIANTSPNALQQFVLHGGIFYVKRGNPEEIQAGLKKLEEIAPFTEETLQQIGNTLLAEGLSELAIEQYKRIITINPGRKDIAKKIADHYVERGNKSRESKQLEESLKFFQEAVSADPLHPDAERLRRLVEQEIKERDARLQFTREMLERAEKYIATAEQEALSGRIAEAIVLLRQALATYEEITDEFPLETQQKNRGIRIVKVRMNELRGQLLESAKNFSGKYPDTETQQTINRVKSDLIQLILDKQIEQSFNAGIQDLLKEMPEEVLRLK